MSAGRLLRRLQRGTDGASAAEFGLAAPFLLIIISGTLEMSQAYYVRTVLQGAVNAAARNSTLQSAQSSTTAIDNGVSKMIRYAMPKATITFSRRNYAEFTSVGQPEDYTDTNKNGKRDAGECFIDLNGNSTWDADLGKTGLGGANDVVVYTVKVSYKQWFGFAKVFGLPTNQTINATTILRNQPFATQTTRNGVQICT